MIIHEIHDLSNRHVVNLMQRSFADIVDIKIENYHPDYSEVSGNIFKILKDGRYASGHGKYCVIEIDGKLVCSAGWNRYELEPEIALILTRMYVDPIYRGKYLVGTNLLPTFIAETVDYAKVWITVNDHNKTIYNWFDRTHKGKTAAMFNNWPNIYKNFVPIGTKDIYYTTQWVIELNRGLL